MTACCPPGVSTNTCNYADDCTQYELVPTRSESHMHDVMVKMEAWAERNKIHPCHTAAILPRGPKKLCSTTLSLIPMVSIARLSVVKQSSFGLPGQYGRRVTRVNGDKRQKDQRDVYQF